MFKKILMRLGLLVLFVLAPILGGVSYSEEKVYHNVEITAYNSYRFDVWIEVKCDFNNSNQNYLYYKELIVPGKGNIKIQVPSNLHKCELWSKVLF